MELVYRDECCSLWVELRETKPYLHTELHTSITKCVKHVRARIHALAQHFDGELYTYCPTPAAERLAQLAGFVEDNVVVTSWYDPQKSLKEWILCP